MASVEGQIADIPDWSPQQKAEAILHIFALPADQAKRLAKLPFDVSKAALQGIVVHSKIPNRCRVPLRSVRGSQKLLVILLESSKMLPATRLYGFSSYHPISARLGVQQY